MKVRPLPVFVDINLGSLPWVECPSGHMGARVAEVGDHPKCMVCKQSMIAKVEAWPKVSF